MITNFIDNNTVITASWLNKVDRAVSDAIGQGTDAPTTPAQVKQNLGLDNVDNTSDLNKPISTATQAAIDAEVATLEATDLLRVPRDSASGAASIPTGTTAERPVSPSQGMLRRNSQLGQWEGYNGSSWDVIPDTSGVVTLTGTQTLQNKTLGPTNTFNGNISGASGSLSSAVNIAGASGHLASFRNKIINGGCQVAQRGAISVTNTIVLYGGADRLYGYLSATTVSSTIQQLSVPVSNLSSTGLYQALGPSTTTGTGTVLIGQRIEAKNTVDLNNKNITVSVNLYHDTGTAQNFAIRVMKGNGVDVFSSPVLLATGPNVSCASGVATRLTYTLPLGSTDANNGLQVDVINTAYPAVSGKYFGIGDFQLEAGSIATPFEHRPYGLELSLCQRYYQVQDAYVPNDSSLPTNLYYKVNMRAVPTVTGSGAGFATFVTTTSLVACRQTSAAPSTVTASAEL